MDGGNIASTLDLGVVPLSWTFAGTVGYNNSYVNYEGRVGAILWRNSNGDLVLWSISYGQRSGTTDLGVVPTSWTVAGTGDFNGDGVADILWRNSNGDVVIWFMNGGNGNGGNGIASTADLGVIPSSWSIQGIGDFAGTGYSDILWRNSDGDLNIWFMNGGTITSSSDLGVIPTSWTPQVTRDFNGDGKADILWHNSSNGDAVIWFMNGATITSTHDFGLLPGRAAIQ
jgi:hypothetical protein